MEDEVDRIIDELNLDAYDEAELNLWGKGYIAALEHILDRITKDQTKLLNKILQYREEEERGKQRLLEARLYVLDAYYEYFKAAVDRYKKETLEP